MYNCIDFTPRREKVPENMRYFMVTKEYSKPIPRDGKKRATKDQMKEYNDMILDRNKMFAELKVGNFVDMGNRYLKMNDISNDLTWVLDKSKEYFIYKIKPINACKHHEQYSSYEEWRVSSFIVDKIMDSLEELLDDLSDTIYYHDAFNYIFDHKYYNANQREHGTNVFENFHNSHPDKKIYVSDCLYNNLHRYDRHSRYSNNDAATELIETLYENGLVELFKEYEDHERNVGEMIKAGWFKLAVEYINGINNLDYGDIYFKDKYKEDVLSTIRLHADNKYVAKIVELLALDNTYVTLVIKEHDDDGYNDRELERKQFKDINEVRTYVIQEHGVSFEDAAKDVGYWRSEDEYLYFEII